MQTLSRCVLIRWELKSVFVSCFFCVTWYEWGTICKRKIIAWLRVSFPSQSWWIIPRTIKNSTLPAKLLLKGNLVVKIRKDYSKSFSFFFCKSENTHCYLCVSTFFWIFFLFRAAPYNHRSATRGAFLRPWEDLRRIWVRFAGGLTLIMSATSRWLVFLKDRPHIFPRMKKRSGRSANNEGCSRTDDGPGFNSFSLQLTGFVLGRPSSTPRLCCVLLITSTSCFFEIFFSLSFLK